MSVHANYSVQESFKIINEYADAPDTKGIDLILQEIKHDSVLLKYLRIAMGIDYTFSPDLGEGYPVGVRLNRDFPDGISDSQLRFEHRGFYLYEANHSIDAKKRVKLFGNMLEAIHYKEADLIIAMKDGKFNELYPNITLEVCNRVYPHLFPTDVPKKSKPAPATIQKPESPVTAQEVAAKLEDAFANLPAPIPRDTTRDAFNLDTNERTLTTVKEIPKPAPAPVVKPPMSKKAQKIDKRSKEYRLQSGRDKD